jgi:hypothetical protein
MRFVLVLITAVIATNSCAGKKDESRQSEQPTEVSGGFGLTMQCTVLNKDVEDAESSSIGCLVFNDDGSRYTGSIDGTTAEIVKTSGGVVTNGQIVSGAAAGSYSIGVEVAGLKPGDAATIRVSAKFDNTLRTLVSSLKGRLATTCDDDVTYYVKKLPENEQNIFCSEDAPCSTISRALTLLPDIINCNITIQIADGVYQESILINDREIRQNVMLSFIGESRENTKILQPLGSSQDPHIYFVSLDSSSSVRKSSVMIKNLSIDGLAADSNRGFDLRSSDLALEDVGISNYNVATHLRDASRIHLKNVAIENVNRGILAFAGTILVRFAGNVSFKGKSPGDRALNLYGIQISGSHQIILDDPTNIKIENFDVGLRLVDSSIFLQPEDSVDISNVRVGLNLVESVVNASSTQDADKTYDPSAAFALSIKNFSLWGISMVSSTLADELALNTAKKFKLTLEGASGSSELIRASDASSIRLTKSDFSFCLQNAATLTPWHNASSNPSFYAFTVHSESDALFGWQQSPFKQSTSCTPAPTNARLFVQTYLHRFLAPSSGAAACPIGYFKASDNVCYGAMGYPRQSMSGAPYYFGVLESDSRIDNLISP